MHVQLDLEGMSQYDDSILKKYRNSACGPTTAYVILNYLRENQDTSVNALYKKLGSTKIGLFKWRLIQNLRKYLGPTWLVEECTVKDALQELDEGRPVAMKFDQYFTLQWRAKPTFKYHWVPLIGYEMKDEQLYLILHDNGGPNRPSRVRTVPYTDNNRKVISFVKIAPKLN